MLRKYFDQYSRLLSSSYCDLLFGFSAFSSWPSLEIGSYFWLQLEAEAEAKTMIFEGQYQYLRAILNRKHFPS